MLLRGISLVVQRLRVCLAMQGTRVPSLVGELRSHMPQPTKLSPCNEDPAQPKKKKNTVETSIPFLPLPLTVESFHLTSQYFLCKNVVYDIIQLCTSPVFTYYMHSG